MNKLDSKKKLFTELFILIFILALIGKYTSIDYTLANVVITGFLLYATYEYAQLTEELVSETNKMRKAQTQPNVYAAIQPVDELNEIMEFFVQNIGSGAAYNIKFVDPPIFQYAKESYLVNVHLIKNGIEFLAPHQEMQVFMMQSFEVFKFNSKDPIDVKIEYTDSEGEEFDRNYKIDFSIVLDVQRMKDRYTSFESRLLDNAENIKKSLHSISSNVKTIANSSIDSTGIIQSDSSKLLFTAENDNIRIEIAKALVKKILLKFYYDWKTYNLRDNSTISTSTLQVESSNFIDIAASVTEILPEKLINDLISCATEMNDMSNRIWMIRDYREKYKEVAMNVYNMYNEFDKYFDDFISK
ncbi:MAG: hypothetical protein AB9861_02675 [Methanosarcina sp.]